MKTQDIVVLRQRAAETAALLKTLSHPNRLLIACQLMEGEQSVGEIEEKSGVRQPVLSRELARLRTAGLVATRRVSKQVFYTLAGDRLERLVIALCAAFSPADGQGKSPSNFRTPPRRARRKA